MNEKQQFLISSKINQLYLNSVIPAVLSGLIGISLVATLWETANQQSLTIWLSITLCMSVVRTSLMIAFKKSKPTGRQVLNWEKPYAISLFITVLNWSIGPLLIIPKHDPSAIFIITVFSIGLAAAATSWYAQIRYIQIGTICMALLPTITVLLTYGTNETLWLGIAACLMFLGCIFTSFFYQKILNDNLELVYNQEQSIIKAETIANTDMLTGLNNRRSFFEIAPAILQDCQNKDIPASLIMFDVDHFKIINDTFGHAAGDIVLQRIASVFTTNLNPPDIACRLGGEEFAILLPNTTLHAAMRTAENFRSAFANIPASFSGKKPLAITASFGISPIGSSIDEMLNNADQAMYQAKNNGRNKVVAHTAKHQ